MLRIEIFQNLDKAMGWFQDLDEAHQCFLACGDIIFRKGDCQDISAYTNGMRLLASLMQKARDVHFNTHYTILFISTLDLDLIQGYTRDTNTACDSVSVF